MAISAVLGKRAWIRGRREGRTIDDERSRKVGDQMLAIFKRQLKYGPQFFVKKRKRIECGFNHSANPVNRALNKGVGEGRWFEPVF